MTAANGKRYSSEMVFVAAFQNIYKEAKRFLKKKKIKNIEDNEIQWIVTVPAIWNDAAKYMMEKWATQAGLVNENISNQCKIVYEPDCASLFIQQVMMYKQKQNQNEDNKENDENKEYKAWKKGEKYILVDAGGGTTDIACHQLLDGAGVIEILHPSGGAWGSCYIDDQYVKLLQDIFSTEWINEFKKEHPSIYTETIDNFQKAKQQFYKNSEAETLNCELPYDFLNFIEDVVEDDTEVEEIVSDFKFGGKANMVSLDDEYLVINTKIWRSMFDHVINPSISHIHGLLSNDKMDGCKYLCLVGGLSTSRYFQYRMQKEFGAESEYQLEIIVPIRPVLCVCEGAAYFGMVKKYIKGRVLRYTYGSAVNPLLHLIDTDKLPLGYLKENQYRCEYTNALRVRRAQYDLSFSKFPVEIIKIICNY